jgi:hypothetical protein
LLRKNVRLHYNSAFQTSPSTNNIGVWTITAIVQFSVAVLGTKKKFVDYLLFKTQFWKTKLGVLIVTQKSVTGFP